MDLSELDYELPLELIAQHPAARRDASRLLVYDRATGAVRHRTFDELPDELHGRLVVVNDTKVVPARIPIASPRGEVLLLERLEDGTWEALARPTRRLRAGRRYGPVELIEHLGEGRWRLRLDGEPAGQTPLPPYITEPLGDPSRYQTVYAREPGSAAAPTAGLHFTPELLAAARSGAGHAPCRARHVPSGERGATRGPPHPRRALRGASRRRGSGSARPSACSRSARRRCACSRRSRTAGRSPVAPSSSSRRASSSGAWTRLVTNFHLPRSTLLALVMAFAGIEETRRLYRLAIEERYRFYSFGDAMLIL